MHSNLYQKLPNEKTPNTDLELGYCFMTLDIDHLEDVIRKAMHKLNIKEKPGEYYIDSKIKGFFEGRVDSAEKFLNILINVNKHLSVDEVFRFYEKSDVDRLSYVPQPEGIDEDLSDRFAKRCTAEFNISLNDLKKILSDTTSEYHGMKFHNPQKAKDIETQLKNHLIEVSIDIKNPQTGSWEKCKVLEEKSPHCCLIL